MRPARFLEWKKDIFCSTNIGAFLKDVFFVVNESNIRQYLVDPMRQIIPPKKMNGFLLSHREIMPKPLHF